MKKTGLKQFPPLHTDDDAEQFVDTADLSEYDMSGMIPLDLAFRQPDGQIFVLVPGDLVMSLRAKAGERGVAFAEIVREALQNSIEH